MAKADNSQGEVYAKLNLPTPIDASEYEISLKYCSLLPTWNVTTDLYMIYRNDSGNMDITVFEDFYISTPATVMAKIAATLSEKYGFNMKTAKAKVIQKGEKFWLAVGKKSSLTLSDSLSEVLGLPKELINSSNTAENYPIKLSLPGRSLLHDVYYVTCDQIKPNLISDELSGIGVLGVVHAPNTFHSEVVKFHAIEKYSRFHDFSRPSTLYIRLLDSAGNQISIDYPQFYVLLHVRKYG